MSPISRTARVLAALAEKKGEGAGGLKPPDRHRQKLPQPTIFRKSTWHSTKTHF
jgi:hypothetical protein